MSELAEARIQAMLDAAEDDGEGNLTPASKKLIDTIASLSDEELEGLTKEEKSENNRKQTISIRQLDNGKWEVYDSKLEGAVKGPYDDKEKAEVEMQEYASRQRGKEQAKEEREEGKETKAMDAGEVSNNPEKASEVDLLNAIRYFQHQETRLQSEGKPDDAVYMRGEADYLIGVLKQRRNRKQYSIAYEAEKAARDKGLGYYTKFIPRKAIWEVIHEPTIAIDLDGTIAEPLPDGYPPPPAPPPPVGDLLEGAKQALTKLRNSGRKILIHTARTDLEQVKAWLFANGIVVDGVENKPLATHYIDDRAVEFDGDWLGIVERIMAEEKSFKVMKSSYKDIHAAGPELVMEDEVDRAMAEEGVPEELRASVKALVQRRMKGE